MLESKCLRCGRKMTIDNIRHGDGYFMGYDTEYYGDSIENEKDPHEIVGWYCQKCGDKIRDKANIIGWKRTD